MSDRVAPAFHPLSCPDNSISCAGILGENMSCPALLCWSYDPKECAVGALCVEEQPRISSPCVGPSVDRISDGLDKLAEERAALQAEFSQQLVEQHAFIFEVPGQALAAHGSDRQGRAPPRAAPAQRSARGARSRARDCGARADRPAATAADQRAQLSRDARRRRLVSGRRRL